MKNVQHVGAMLSGYLDGELTQQDRQLIDVHVEDCEDCAATLAELTRLKARISEAELSAGGAEIWREVTPDPTVETAKLIGWGALCLGGLLLVGYVLYDFVIDPTIGWLGKAAFGLIYTGFSVLLISVARQRLIERKFDKFNDVEV